MSAPRVLKLVSTAANRIRERLEALDYEFKEVPHAAWSARGEGAVVTYYASGKLVVAGKGTEAFIEGRVGWEEDERPTGDPVEGRVIGTDEAGKGDYFGPLVTAAVLVDPSSAKALARAGVRDSKELRDAAALAIAARIRDLAPCAVVAVGPERYNELRESMGNLNHLLAWTHAKAAAEVLSDHEAEGVVADKFANARVLETAFRRESIEVPLTQRTRAESHPAVAAASVLARAEFLRRLERLGEEVGRPLPKGAGAPVDEAVRALVKEHGRDVLGRIAKVHFKNTKKALESLF